MCRPGQSPSISMDHAGLEFSTFPKSGGLVSPAEFAGMTGGIAGDATLESIRCLIVHLVKQFLKRDSRQSFVNDKSHGTLCVMATNVDDRMGKTWVWQERHRNQ